MNKKGFTLIELVGVIVLLGIMAVITVPIVRNITKDAKQKGYEKQINVVLESSKNWAIQNTDLLPENNTSILVKMDTLKKEGFLENKKIINSVNNKEMKGCAKITYNTDFNQYEYEYNAECFLQNEIMTSENSCIQAGNTCSADDINSNSGILVNVKVNNEQTEDFYVLADDGNTVTLILNRNLGDNVAWYADVQDNSFGPITALTALQDRTNTWTNLPEMTINTFDYDDSRDDVTLGNNKSFTTYTRLPKYSEIYAVNNSDTLTNTPWLYINLKDTGDDNAVGYWTSTANATQSIGAHDVYYYGNIDNYYVDNASNDGVRPVIELSKSAPIY